MFLFFEMRVLEMRAVEAQGQMASEAEQDLRDGMWVFVCVCV